MHRTLPSYLEQEIRAYNSETDIAQTGGIKGMALADRLFNLRREDEPELEQAPHNGDNLNYPALVKILFEPFTVPSPAGYDYQHRFQRLHRSGYPLRRGYSTLSREEAKSYFLKIQKEISKVGREKCPELLEGMVEYNRMTRDGLLD
jgi:hypothetical protein